MRESVNVDHCIIGGGVVGLFTAYFLQEKFPKDTICLLEKNVFLGEGSTSRNSGVLHSGIYYPKNSLKHLLCIEGLSFWKSCELFDEESIKTTGKYIFAMNSTEQDRLDSLREKGINNGVEGLRFASKVERKEISQYVNCSSALFSPSSGLVNVPLILKKLENHLDSKGVMIMKSHGDFSLRKSKSGFTVEYPDYDIEVSNLFNCAGLSAVEIRKKLNLNELSDYYVKGSYLSTTQKISHPTLLYPIPPLEMKGLGVHSTMNWDGTIKFGPNTRDVEEVNYSLEEEDLESMKESVMQMFKGIERSKLYPDYSGIRAKVKKDNNLWTDFWIRSGKEFNMPGYFEACGIESPGLTASPAIGRKMASFVY